MSGGSFAELKLWNWSTGQELDTLDLSDNFSGQQEQEEAKMADDNGLGDDQGSGVPQVGSKRKLGSDGPQHSRGMQRKFLTIGGDEQQSGAVAQQQGDSQLVDAHHVEALRWLPGPQVFAANLGG